MKYLEFFDFDAFAESVKDINSTMILNNINHRFWSIGQVNLPEIHIQIGQLGSGNIVEGQSCSDGFLIYMPLTDSCPYCVNGEVLDKHSLITFEPGANFCISTKTEHDWFSIYIPSSKIAAKRDFLELSSGAENNKCQITRPNGQLLEQLRVLAQPIMTAAANCQEFESSTAATFAAEELEKVASLIILDKQISQHKLKRRPKIPRQEIIRCSKILLEELGHKPCSIRDLVAAVGVSERTLRTAFKDYFGIGPIKYLQLRQLHEIHRELKKAAPDECKVSEVMVKYGVWEFGRCASRYRQLFGELPSETLRKL